MATSKSLDQRRERDRSHGYGGGAMGQRILGQARDAAASLGTAIISRERVCFGLMVLFCATVVAPAILTFADRSLPFEYISIIPREKVAPAGSKVHLDFTIGHVNDEASGKFDRYFYDRKGKPTFYGTFRTIYHKYAEPGEVQSVARQFTKVLEIPDDAACGEGTYVSVPSFWHNPVQGWIKPIKGPIWRATITVTGNCTQ